MAVAWPPAAASCDNRSRRRDSARTSPLRIGYEICSDAVIRPERIRSESAKILVKWIGRFASCVFGQAEQSGQHEAVTHERFD
jgi:hypothetical protein